MRYLIDTNILLFYVSGLLTAEVKAILNDYSNRVYIPSKCVEELIYLQQSGKIGVKQWKSAEAIVDFIIGEMGFGIKYIAEEHLRTLARLPLFPGHKDPTDRIIIAQAITEKTPIISNDRKFHRLQAVWEWGLCLIRDWGDLTRGHPFCWVALVGNAPDALNNGTLRA